MDHEIQLFSDGDGLAVIGDPAAVDLFLSSEGLVSKELDAPRLGAALRTGSAGAQAGSKFVAGSGRWVKLTEESAQKVKQFGLMESKTPGVSHAMVGKPGDIKGWLQISKGSVASNPAVLAGVGGIMAQLAMQQAMDEITDYLASIDEKVEDVLRAQKDAALSKLIGVGFDIEEAMSIREQVGGVNEITWSKVQAAPATIAEVQAYALRQLDALAEKLERKTKAGDIAKAARKAEAATQEWLAVLARCFQLQDAIAVLELDRVLEAAPEDLDGHRMGLKAARHKRLGMISRSTERLLGRMDAAASAANEKVLLHPRSSPVVVQSGEHVAAAVTDFHGRLGIESGRASLEARRWGDAAAERWDKIRETGAERFDASKRRGGETLERAKGRLSSGIADLRRRGADGLDEEIE